MVKRKPDILSLPVIRAALRDRRVSMVAKATGLNRNTIAAVRDGADVDHVYTTILILSQYLTQTGAVK